MTQEKNITNGLKYSKEKTSAIPVVINSDADILNAAPTENAWFIAYLFHRVVIGRVVDKQFVYYKQADNDVTLENIQKLRVFNKDSELFVWRTALDGCKARLRKDGEGKEQGVVDARQVMFGTEATQVQDDNAYSCLTEERGTKIILPLKDLPINDSEINKKEGRLCIHTRSYIGYIEETGQATYEDVRFVEFVMYKEEKL